MPVKRCTLLVLVAAAGLHAETGRAAWLRYAAVSDSSARQYRETIPAVVAGLGDAAPIHSARWELLLGIRGMLGRTVRLESRVPNESAIVLGTLGAIRQAFPQFDAAANLEPDGYWLKTLRAGTVRYTIVTAANDRGVLYGAFALLRKIALGDPVGDLDEKQSPFAPVRWINQWDNLDGSIERGYGGQSIFWENGHVREDLTRAGEYARLLASLGINGCSINNVNANPRILASDFIPQVARVAAAFRPWGIQAAISVDFGSPQTVGGLDTFDPLDPRVAAWWKSTVDQLYRAVPDLAGFVLKADSEGRVGPSAYGRTHADAANVVARALQPHGGLLFYRGFVYDHHMDWRNPKNDRARAAYDNFKELDGKFDDNVVIQIKNGPIDFQVREPASPLLGALERTSQAVELQITQEYMGQARHTVFLVPMWKETLDFDMHAGPVGSPAPTPVKALVAGKVFHRPAGGFVGVANVGLDENWAANHLSMANLYGFGRLAWDPDLSARRLAEEWTRLTFGDDPKVVETVVGTQLSSWRTYENYTGPLGLQTLTDITGDHYGVAVEASERNGWGQWHNADEKGAGMDRTVATGTGFIGQYHPAVARVYEAAATCPDDLLLFLHHVPYTYKLHSGKTVIQYIYDSHYEGADAVAGYVDAWKPLQGRVDDQRYGEVLAQLEYQAGQAQVWRDAVAMWFLRASGIPDAQGRVGHYPGRFEAESMALEGYTVGDVVPWEAASGGKAVVCAVAQCAATLRFNGAPGWYTLRIQYFDLPAGVSRFRVLVAKQVVDEWTAADHLPARKIDASASVRRFIPGIALRPGDEIRIEGVPGGGDPAALDYIEILSAPVAAAALDNASGLEPVSRTDQNSLTAHAQLLEKARKGRIDIYFEGDSITRRWGATDYPDLLAHWNRNFFGWNAADFGWGADTIQNILWRLDNGELDGVNPKIIVLLAGTNNVGNTVPLGGDEAKAADIARGIQAILGIMETKAPGATIVLTGIFPRNDNLAVMPTIDKINHNLSKLADGKKIRYLNVNDKLADRDGRLFDGMMNAGDKLHPTVKGYQVWADALKPIFSELLGPPGKQDQAPPPTGDPSARR
jgi:alpha-glucuronidase